MRYLTGGDLGLFGLEEAIAWEQLRGLGTDLVEVTEYGYDVPPSLSPTVVLPGGQVGRRILEPSPKRVFKTVSEVPSAMTPGLRAALSPKRPSVTKAPQPVLKPVYIYPHLSPTVILPGGKLGRRILEPSPTPAAPVAPAPAPAAPAPAAPIVPEPFQMPPDVGMHWPKSLSRVSDYGKPLDLPADFPGPGPVVAAAAPESSIVGTLADIWAVGSAVLQRPEVKQAIQAGEEKLAKVADAFTLSVKSAVIDSLLDQNKILMKELPPAEQVGIAVDWMNTGSSGPAETVKWEAFKKSTRTIEDVFGSVKNVKDFVKKMKSSIDTKQPGVGDAMKNYAIDKYGEAMFKAYAETVPAPGRTDGERYIAAEQFRKMYNAAIKDSAQSAAQSIQDPASFARNVEKLRQERIQQGRREVQRRMAERELNGLGAFGFVRNLG